MDPHLLSGLATVAAVVLAAVVLHLVVFALADRYGLQGETARHMRSAARWPSRLTVGLLAGLLVLPVTDLADGARTLTEHLLRIALVAAITWLLLRLIGVAAQAVVRRHDIDVADNLHARRKRTQALVLSRVASVLTVTLGLAIAMLTFEQARAVGASLLASAGVAGLIAGIAARTTLGNLIAGLQIAFTEPIRIDDVVVVEGEWGRIEEITLTYVVVRIWDARRLVLPTSYFVERPFQNWTRTSAQVLGGVTLHLDYAAPVEELRTELHRVLQRSDKWDGDAWVLQVIDVSEQTIEVRALMTAVDAPTSWDLRCEVREHLIRFLQQQHPGALPRLRVAEAEVAPGREVPQPRRAQGRDIGELDALRWEPAAADGEGL